MRRITQMLRIAPLLGGLRSQQAGIGNEKTSGRIGFPRPLNKKQDERPDVPSEPSLRAEQICEHPRNRCPKSALGLAVAVTALALVEMLVRSSSPDDTLELRRASEVHH